MHDDLVVSASSVSYASAASRIEPLLVANPVEARPVELTGRIVGHESIGVASR